MPVINLVPADPIAALEALGIEVQRTFRDQLIAPCPMHEQRVGKPDSNPSWSLNAVEGIHNCFSCGYSGTFVSLVSDLLGINEYRAIRWIRRNGLSLDVLDNLPATLQERQPVEKKAPEIPELARFTDPPATALEKRHITAEACVHFGVRWDPERRGWVLPITRPDGLFLGYQVKRKKYVRNRPDDVPKSETLFGIAQLHSRRAILVESPLDVVKLYTDGIEGGVSSYGVAVSTAQMTLLNSRAEEVVLALDNDFAGRGETRRLITGKTFHERDDGRVEVHEGTAWAKKMSLYVFDYGDAEEKDVGEMGRQAVYRGVNKALHSLEWIDANLTLPRHPVASGVRRTSSGRAGTTRAVSAAHARRGPYRRR